MTTSTFVPAFAGLVGGLALLLVCVTLYSGRAPKRAVIAFAALLTMVSICFRVYQLVFLGR